MLTGALKSLFAVSEAYPDLKANQNFLNLQEELTGTEDKIAYARQFYNDTVYKYNTKIQPFPAMLIAGPFHFAPASTSRPTTTPAGPVKVSVLSRRRAGARCTTRSSRTSAVLPSSSSASSRWSSVVAFAFDFVFTVGWVGVAHRRSSSPAGWSFVSYWNSDKVALSLSHAEPADRAAVRPALQPRRGAHHRQRAAHAAALHRRRPGAERLRHRARPEARGHRRHDRACSRR